MFISVAFPPNTASVTRSHLAGTFPVSRISEVDIGRLPTWRKISLLSFLNILISKFLKEKYPNEKTMAKIIILPAAMQAIEKADKRVRLALDPEDPVLFRDGDKIGTISVGDILGALLDTAVITALGFAVGLNDGVDVLGVNDGEGEDSMDGLKVGTVLGINVGSAVG